MKSILIAILWRLGVGVAVAMIGLILSLVLNNWNIEYTWFGALGFICILLSLLPLAPGSKRGDFAATFITSRQEFTDTTRRTFNSTANFTITMFLIGLVNLGVPILTYYVTN